MKPPLVGSRPGSAPQPTVRPGGQRRSSALTALGALGVVFGDIGTSPLYALHMAFSMEHNAVSIERENVYGIISMLVWTITLIVTVKYVVLVLRADNDGEGGILALLGVLKRQVRSARTLALVTLLGMLGAALFYGDALITPAISVMSSVEGAAVVAPGLAPLVVPVSVLVLALLFLSQPLGTGRVARALGPVMLLWFAALAAFGLTQVIRHPQILVSLSPHWAIELVARHPLPSFILLGAVVLAVTGAEALYADLGHFGARAIRRAWLFVVMPALVLVYLGQGALVIEAPATADSPLVHLVPEPLRLAFVVLSTVVTIIASQAVISGAFSVTRQAVRLGFLPRLTLRHTSRREEGQIYLPAVNWALCGGVIVLIVLFGSSAGLASAYGLAVTGTLVLESGLFLLLAVLVWRWQRWKTALYVGVIGMLEIMLLAANSAKLLSGGWLPLLVAALALLTMTTWRRGAGEVSTVRRQMEQPTQEISASLRKGPVRRIPGTAIFPHSEEDTVPLALSQCLKTFRALHEHVVIVRIVQVHAPHVPPDGRVSVSRVGIPADGIWHVDIRLGFADDQDIPRNLALVDDTELDLDVGAAVYVVSVLSVFPPYSPRLRDWRRLLFLVLKDNQADHREVLRLPHARTVVLGAELRA